MPATADPPAAQGARLGRFVGMRMLFADARRNDPTGFWMSLLLGLVAALLSPLYPLLFKLLVDAAVDHQTQRITAVAAAIAVIIAGAGLAQSYAAMFGWNLWERMTFTIDEHLVALSARVGLVDRVERADYLERLTLVRTGREHFQESMMSLVRSALLALQVVVTIVILVSVAPFLLVLPLFSLAPIWAGRWAETRAQRALKASAADTRAADAFALLSVDPAAAGELRVLGLRELVIGRHEAAWQRTIARQWRAETQGAIVSTLALMLFTLGFGGALLLVTRQSLHGSATIGSVILVLTAGQQLHNQVAGVLSGSADLFRILELTRHYAWLVQFADDHEERGAAMPARRLEHGIRLDRVSFRYAGADEDAIHDLSLTLPAGAVVAIVGENGAGKSTLVSLLCGLHRPSRGRITVDGTDLSDLHAPTWRGSVSGALQDFVRYEVLARESVGIGSIADADDAGCVRRALARADVADLEDELAAGLETPLGRAFLDGIDLSGGQWQKVALARAMMRAEPLVLVLDEPTYSLDVESERRVYEWFSRVAADDARTITVIVSHRFSSVRAADYVAVLHRGELVQWGTHEQLLGEDGPYARMYRTQAEGYR